MLQIQQAVLDKLEERLVQITKMDKEALDKTIKSQEACLEVPNLRTLLEEVWDCFHNNLNKQLKVSVLLIIMDLVNKHLKLKIILVTIQILEATTWVVE